VIFDGSLWVAFAFAVSVRALVVCAARVVRARGAVPAPARGRPPGAPFADPPPHVTKVRRDAP